MEIEKDLNFKNLENDIMEELNKNIEGNEFLVGFANKFKNKIKVLKQPDVQLQKKEITFENIIFENSKYGFSNFEKRKKEIELAIKSEKYVEAHNESSKFKFLKEDLQLYLEFIQLYFNIEKDKFVHGYNFGFALSDPGVTNFISKIFQTNLLIPVGIGMGISFQDISNNTEIIKLELQRKITLGLEIHAIINQICKMMIENEDLFTEKGELEGMIENIEDEKKKRCLFSFCNFIFSCNSNGHRFRDYMVGTEIILQDKNSGMTGTADNIFLFPDQIPLIVDFKTGKHTLIDGHLVQLLLYGMLLECCGIISNQCIVYLGGEDFKEIKIKKRLSLISNTEKQDEKFKNSLQYLCQELKIEIEKKDRNLEKQKEIATKIIHTKELNDCCFNNMKNEFIEKFKFANKRNTPNYYINFWFQEISKIIDSIDSNTNEKKEKI